MQRVSRLNPFASLVLKQVNCMRGVVPQEMVRPIARLAQRIRIVPPQEMRLDVELAQDERTAINPFVQPPVAGVKPPCMRAHRDQPRALLTSQDCLCSDE
ncbi:hypothetical protein PTKU46_90770 [Paraburkholderia terrae]